MRKFDPSLICPSEEDVQENIAVQEHAAHPIKNVEDIMRMSEHMREHGKLRDLFLWTLGINTGLRVSDLLRLRWGDLLDGNSSSWREEIVIQEKKTANTKKRAVNRHIAINRAVRETGMEYLHSLGGVSLDKFVFRSESNRGKNQNRPIHRNNVEVMLKKVAKACGVTVRVSCHTMRKTYAYHILMQGGNSQRQLILLQKMLNHSSALQTLTYAGITEDEMRRQYNKLNLGVRENVVTLPVAITQP